MNVVLLWIVAALLGVYFILFVVDKIIKSVRKKRERNSNRDCSSSDRVLDEKNK